MHSRSLFVLAGCLLAASGLTEPIQLRAAQFDPQISVPRVDPRMESVSGSPHQLLIVQFSGPVSNDHREAIVARGGRPMDYLPTHALLVRGDRTALADLPGVSWIGAYHPAYRLAPEFGTRVVRDAERAQEVANGVFRAAVSLTLDADPTLVEAMINGLGATVYSSGRFGADAVLMVRGTMEQIRNVARIEAVSFIEDASEPQHRNATSRWIVQTNVSTAGATPLYAAGITGSGQVIGVLDNGIRSAHVSFGSGKILFSNTTSNASHGTHVAATAAGNDGTWGDLRGVAYGAQIAFSRDPFSSSTPTETSFYNMLELHYNNGARVHTNSWGDDGTTAYTVLCRAIDNFSRNYESSLVLLAITNFTGVLRTPENAKSVLAVSATRDTPNQESAPSTFSGTGPTADGRRKPEIAAPGEGIVSASSASNTGTNTLSGTSMATPAVAGTAALVRQFLAEGRLRDGNARPEFAMTDPTGALVRAIILTSGRDMTGVTGYPGGREGFGRVMISKVLPLPGDADKTLVRDVRNADGLSTGQSSTFRFRVTDSTRPLRVMMTFTDQPAAVAAASAPVNDLSMTVTAPGGAIYRGNVFDTTTGFSITGGSADTINSAEMVNLNDPVTSGLYTVTINATAVNAGGPQGYALVVNGGVIGSEIQGTLNFGGWVGSIPSSMPMTFVNASGTPYPGGTVNAVINPVTRAFTVSAPPTVTGAYRLRINHAAFLRKQFPAVASTDLFASFGSVNLINGDPDRSGEVDAADIDLVIANFGSTTASPVQGDVDGSGEVDAADIDVVIANFGSDADF